MTEFNKFIEQDRTKRKHTHANSMTPAIAQLLDTDAKYKENFDKHYKPINVVSRFA